MKSAKIAAIAALMAFGTTACDLAVENNNNPDRNRALTEANDVQALISGSWWQWYQQQHNYGISMSPSLSTMSFQHSAYPANFAMVDFSTIPRAPIKNQTSDPNYVQFSGHWTQSYRAIAAVNAGLTALDLGTVDLGEQGNARARAYGRFIQGISHGAVAMLFEQGPVVDEKHDLTERPEFVSKDSLLAASLNFLDDAIALSSTFTDSIPADWFGGLIIGGRTPQQLAQMASSYKAMLRVATARTPEEADRIDWNAVLQEVNDGITEDVKLTFDGGTRWFGSLYYTLLGGWSQLNYQVFGMADQSGKYQQWMALPATERHPDFKGEGDPFLIITPDTRFPQGATLAEQFADNRGYAEQRFMIPRASSGNMNVGDQWARDDRGTWRWSYYRDSRSATEADVGSTPYISYREQRLLAAEAHYRLGQLAEAAAIINETRTAAGLNATDASGTNTSCVPKLPNGDCGDLWEMLKWERRMEASHQGQYLMNTMYFDSRRWGDLMEGTVITLAVPCREAELEAMACEDRGGADVGVAGGAAPVGTYGY